MHELSHSMPNLEPLATSWTVFGVLDQIRVRFRTTAAIETLLKAILKTVAVHLVTSRKSFARDDSLRETTSRSKSCSMILARARWTHVLTVPNGQFNASAISA